MAWVTKSSEESYDTPQQPERVYTRSEKAKNWWYYHKVAVFIVAVIAVCALWLIHDLLTNQDPDYQVAWVGQTSLSDETVAVLEQALARYGQDRDGDGQVTVGINQYVLDLSETAETAQTAMAYDRMAAMTRLSADMGDGVNCVYLLQDPESFQTSTGALRYLDGTLPETGAQDWQNMVYLWSDCPALAELELPATGESSIQDQLSQVYVGRCGAWTDAQVQAEAESEDFWTQLTRNAVPLSGSGE